MGRFFGGIQHGQLMTYCITYSQGVSVGGVLSQDLFVFLPFLLLSKELYPRAASSAFTATHSPSSTIHTFSGWDFSLVLTTDDSGQEEWAWQCRARGKRRKPIDSA